MSFFAIAAILAYLIASGWCGLRLFQHPMVAQWVYPFDRWFGLCAVVIHLMCVGAAVWLAGGLALSFFSAVSFAACLMAGWFLISAMSKPVESLGIVVFPLAACGLAVATLLPQRAGLPHAASWGLNIHILSSMLAYAILCLAAIQAFVLAIQDRQLRRHQAGGFIRGLPPLQTMETLLFELIGLGWIVLSIALIGGFAYLHDIFAQHLVHKSVLSVCAWFLFAGLLWGRWQCGWRGRTAIRWTWVGFVFLMVAYFGSKAVLLSLIHI